MPKKKIKGIIVSHKMDKTAVVLVERFKKHPIYRKQYQVSEKFFARDVKNEYKKGDIVNIEETRPFSKKVHWRIIGKVKK